MSRAAGHRAPPPAGRKVRRAAALRFSAAAALASLSAAAAGQGPILPYSPLVIDAERADRAPVTTPAPPPPPAAPAQVDAAPSGMAIRSIAFDGAAVPEPVARAARAYVGRTADGATLTRLAQDMATAYARSAVALYGVQVPAQDMAGGRLRVSVTEGYVEAVSITGDVAGGGVDRIRACAGRIAAERPLSRATLERELSLIRDTPGLTLDAQLLQGSRPGASRLILTLHRKRHEFSGGFDNRSTRLIDQGSLHGQAKFYGLLREGDETDVAGAASLDFSQSRYLSLSHATPLGDDGTRLSASIGYLATRPKRYDVRGEAEIAAIGISRPVLRGYRRNLTLSAALDGVNSDNAAFGSVIDREHSRALRIAAAASDAAGRHAATASLTVSRGLDILGARETAPVAQAVFTKVNARVSFDRAIGKRLTLRTKAIGQYSRDALPAVERFAVGGADFGRGFANAVVAGDRGVAGSVELAWRPLRSAAFGGSEVYGFVDGADVSFVRRGPFAAADYDLASAGAGLRLALRQRAAIDIEAAHVIDRPFPDAGDDWTLSLAWRLALKE